MYGYKTISQLLQPILFYTWRIFLHGIVLLSGNHSLFLVILLLLYIYL